MLSQLGCVTHSGDLLEKVDTRTKLTEAENKLFKNHPEVAYHPLNRIPHLEQVALMIRNQNDLQAPTVAEGDAPESLSEETLLGAQMLFFAGPYEDLRIAGASHTQTIESRTTISKASTTILLKPWVASARPWMRC